MKRIWITWETQRRNLSLSEALGAQLYELDFSSLPSVFRYIKCTVYTLCILYREKPHTLFVQNPSLILATLAIIISKTTNINIVIDAHNGGIKPSDGKSKFLKNWANFILKNTPVTIVTNKGIRQEALQNTNTEIAILPDPLPSIKMDAKKTDTKGKSSILFICTWASDEPYLNVINAANFISNETYIYITGDYHKVQDLELTKLPGNVLLTGFISTKEFDKLLYSVDAVMDLTTRENCLVCGAYESISIEKPVILSKTQALQNHFPGMVYTNNEVNDIAFCIKTMLDDLNQFSKEAKKLKQKLTIEWIQQRDAFENTLTTNSR